MGFVKNYDFLDAKEFSANGDNLKEVVDTLGMAVVDLERLDVERLYTLAHKLGKLMIEPRPSVREQAFRGSIIRFASGESDDHSALTQDIPGMHIEHAFSKPPYNQPKYIFLGCITPADPSSGSQTVVCNTRSILANLNDEEKLILSNSRQRDLLTDNKVSENTIITTYKNNAYISFWDAGPFGETWDLQTSNNVSREEAKAAVKHMLDLSVDPDRVRAIPWRKARVLAFDNHKFLHGRTPQIRPSPRVILRAKVLDLPEN